MRIYHQFFFHFPYYDFFGEFLVVEVELNDLFFHLKGYLVDLFLIEKSVFSLVVYVLVVSEEFLLRLFEFLLEILLNVTQCGGSLGVLVLLEGFLVVLGVVGRDVGELGRGGGYEDLRGVALPPLLDLRVLWAAESRATADGNLADIFEVAREVSRGGLAENPTEILANYDLFEVGGILA